MERISVNQINLQHSAAAMEELSRRLGSIDLIQEPHVREGRVVGLNKRGSRVFVGGPDARTCVCVRDGRLQVVQVLAFCGRDMCTVSINIGEGRWLYLASVYLDILDEGVIPESLLGLVEYTGTRNIPLLLSMDCNAHSVLWGESSNGRGEFWRSSWIG